MINLLLIFLLSISSGQTIPNVTNVPTQPPVLSKTGPLLMDNIPSQTVSLGVEETYTIAAHKYFYAPDDDMLFIGEIKFYQESNMESHGWLSFDQPHSTLIMSPSEKKDIGDHELIITAVNSIRQNASQIMTIHVIYNPEEGCGTNFDSEWYAWAIPSIIAIAAVPTCLYQALVKKNKKR